MKKTTCVAIFIAGLFLGLVIDMLLKGYISMDSLKYINNNFADILGFFTNLVMVIVTVVYVLYTYRLTKNSETTTVLAEKSAAYSKQVAIANIEMVESMHLQLKQSNHPCVMPKILSTYGTNCFNDGSRQLNIELELSNIGNGPALSVYAFAWFKLKYTNSNQLVPMFFYPGYKPSISVNGNCNVHVRFGTKAIIYLLNDLKKSYELNMIRIKTDSSKPVFEGTDLILRVYYKNISDQWYEVTYSRIIDRLRTLNLETLLENEEVLPDEANLKNTTKSIPPEELLSTERFEMEFVSELFSTLSVNLISSETISDLLGDFDKKLFNHSINLSEGKNHLT